MTHPTIYRKSTSYFGYPAGGADPTGYTGDDSWANFAGWNNNAAQPFTCSGSGTKRVFELSAYISASVGGNVRLGVYDTSGNLVGQGIAQVATINSPSWQGHIGIATLKAAGGADGSAVNLTGGTNYILACSFDAADSWARNAGTTNDFYYKAGDLTGGMSDPLPSEPTAVNYFYSIRCGVQ